ncbi:MAG: glycosyltransferase family 39 protein [Oscillochloridaceae bacterium]|nr:glycosyltransferase family 39 protein [Chloroflexaceae bacterium]MDW8390104.1 glycosyltransferase family 39 protein [Oscillochloridaceae bacterium]
MKKIALTAVAPSNTERTRVAGRPWLLWISLAGLTLAALLLRAATIGQTLPFVDHPDEPVHLDQALTMLRTGDPNQQLFWKPSLHTYLLLAVIQARYLWGRAAGIYPPIQEMLITTHIVTTVPEFFLAARLLTALVGALTVLAAYSLGARGWNAGAGLVGALLVAVLPLHLRFSQWATTDALATLLTTLALGTTLLALRDGTWRAYLTAGAFAGLAASTKYNAGVVAGAIVAAAALRAWNGRRAGWSVARREGARLLAAGLAAIATFVAGTPYAVLRWDQVSRGIAEQWGNYGGGNGHYRGAWNVGGYVEFFTGDGLGLLACLIVLAGLLILARRRPAVLGVWLGFAAPSLLLHLSRPTHFMQNMLPLLAACSFPAGVAVVELPRLLAPRAATMQWFALAALVLALVTSPALRSSAEISRQAAGDSRRQLLNWIDANVPPGARLAAELPPVPSPTEPRWSYVPWLAEHDLTWYRAQGFAYLIATSHSWGQIAVPPAYAPLLPATVAEFGPRVRREEMLGPHILVIATGLNADDARQPLSDDVRIGEAWLRGVTVGDPSGDGEPPMLLPAATFTPGGVLGLRTFWDVEGSFADDYYIFVHLVDAAGRRPAQRDAQPWQGRYPTSMWRAGSLVVDHNDVYLPPTMAPGVYRVIVGMYDPASGARAPVTVNGAPLPEGAVEVATIIVGR